MHQACPPPLFSKEKLLDFLKCKFATREALPTFSGSVSELFVLHVKVSTFSKVRNIFKRNLHH